MKVKEIRMLLEVNNVTLVEEVTSILCSEHKICKKVDISELYQYDNLQVLSIKAVPFSGFEDSNIEIFIRKLPDTCKICKKPIETGEIFLQSCKEADYYGMEALTSIRQLLVDGVICENCCIEEEYKSIMDEPLPLPFD